MRWIRTFCYVAAALVSVATSSCGWVDAGVGGNEPPRIDAADADYEVVEGATLEVAADTGLLSHVKDLGGASLALRVVEPPRHGTLDVAPDGAFVYRHDGSDEGVDSFRYVANDGIDDSEPVTITIAVAPVQDPPVLLRELGHQRATEADPFELDAGAVFMDPDGDPLQFTAIGLPDSFFIDRDTGRIHGTPTNKDVAAGPDYSVEITADDGHGNTVSTRFGLKVTDVNLAPVQTAGISEQSAEEGQPFRLDLRPYFADPDRDPLNLHVTGAPEALTMEDGVLQGTPDHHASAGSPYDVLIVVSDGQLEIAVPFTLTITDVNQPPRVLTTPPDRRAREGAAVDWEVASFFGDPDGDPLRFSIARGPEWLEMNAESGRLTGTPDFDDAGEVTVTVVAADPSGLEAGAAFGIEVENLNREPLPSGDNTTVEVLEGQSANIDLNDRFTDEDGDALDFALREAPPWADVDGHLLRLAPGYEDAGHYLMTIVAADPDGATAAADVNVSVVDTNRSPVATFSPQQVKENEPFVYDLNSGFSDPDGDPLSFSARNLPHWLELEGDRLIGTPGDKDAGYYRIELRAEDTGGASATAKLDVEVIEGLQAPRQVGSIPYTRLDEGEAYAHNLSDVFSGDRLAYSHDGPDWLFIDKDKLRSRKGFSVTGEGSRYARTVTVTASNDAGSAGASFTLEVNRRPTASVIPDVALPADGVLDYDAGRYFADPDKDDSLGFRVEPGSLGIDERGRVTGSPGGDTNVTVTASDGSLSVSAGFRVTVDDTAPEPVEKCWDVDRDDEREGELDADDDDHDKLTFRLAGGADDGYLETDKGIVILQDNTTGAFTYTPKEGAEGGRDTFSFEVEDLAGNRSTGTSVVIVEQTIMALGDSLTVGLTDGALSKPEQEVSGGYRAPLYESLLVDGYPVDMVGSQRAGGSVPMSKVGGTVYLDPDMEGYLDADLQELGAGIRNWLSSHPADVVLLQAGTDRLQEASVNTVDYLLDEIERWENGPGGRAVTVVVGTLTPQDPPNAAVEAFNTGLRALVDRRQASGDDVLLADHYGRLSTADLADGIHPNDSGYAKMADAWLDVLHGRGDDGRGRLIDKCD